MYSVIIKLAFNNAFLRLSRTLLVVLMISISMGMMLSIQGLYDGMTLTLIENSKDSDSGEITLFHKNYRLSQSLEDNIKNAKEIQESLAKREEVKAVVVRLKAEGLCATARKSTFAKIIGIELEEEERFGHFSQFLKEGELNLSKRYALVGKELAKRMKLQIGSKIIFSTQDSTGEINALSLRVKGIVQTNNITLDASAIYVKRDRVSKFLALDASEGNQIALRTDSTTLHQALAKEYKELEVKSFLELYPMIKQMQELMEIFNSVTFFIVMIVVSVGIMGVMYVSILERIREFGIMKSIGMPYKFIRLQIYLEALFIALLGYIFGAIFGVLILLYLQKYGLDLSAFAEGMESFGMGSIIYATIKVEYFTYTFMAIISSSILSVWLPLRKIKTMNTIEVTKVDI